MEEDDFHAIGKGTWIDKVADTLIKREKKLGRKLDIIRVESGLGASGIPHIGSMGDAVRAYGISLALQNFGFKSELIAYSDDMDGLRKVPYGLPDWLKDHLTKPVSSIPDPFGDCHASYGAHMSSLLLDGLNRAGIKYRFQSGAESYKKGLLVDQIDAILKNSSKLGQKIASLVGQDKYVEILPYFPLCENCGRLYTTKAEKYLPDEKKVAYTCAGGIIGKNNIPGCGHRGEADIRSGQGKLAWKVEFAARWQAFDIRFEAYGKDIMDSVRVNDWVADEILGYSHPLHVKYEMFLDKGGKKISKSAGNVLTPQMWMKYGTPESILLLLFKRIAGTRHVGLDDVPLLMKEYDEIEDIYFEKVKETNKAKLARTKGLYEYINLLDPPKQSGAHVSYDLVVQQASVIPATPERSDLIFNRLQNYGVVKERTEGIMKRIELASNWADDNKETEVEQKFALSDSQKKLLSELVRELRSFEGKEKDPESPKKIQSKVFDIARANNIEPKEFFSLLYRILINAERGPRIGNYAIDIGIERICGMLERYL